jgi:hypothetical protein
MKLTGAIALGVATLGLAIPCLAVEPLQNQRPVRIPAPVAASTPDIPAASPAGADRGAQVLEIPLPENFKGCWRGTVTDLDSRRRVGGWWPPAFLMIWTAKTYEFCFLQRGIGAWELIYNSQRDDKPEMMEQRDSSLAFVSMDGPGAVVLKATMVLAQRTGLTSGAVDDETTLLHCQIASDGTMAVRGDLNVNRNDLPWAEATWHANFVLTGDLR